MTDREKKLLEIAKEILDANKCSAINMALTGGLMLAHLGINKRREAKDIDIIFEAGTLQVDGSYLGLYDEWGTIKVPSGFLLYSCEGDRSNPESIVYYNKEMDIKVDFISTECTESTEIIDGINCGDVEICLERKIDYIKGDIDDESSLKHMMDIQYILENNREEDLEDVGVYRLHQMLFEM